VGLDQPQRAPDVLDLCLVPQPPALWIASGPPLSGMSRIVSQLKRCKAPHDPSRSTRKGRSASNPRRKLLLWPSQLRTLRSR
jgi:hypothetical protein